MKVKEKFKNKKKNIKGITLFMNFTIYEEHLHNWKPYVDYDSMPVPIDDEVYFIGGRKHCPIVCFNISESKWK